MESQRAVVFINGDLKDAQFPARVVKTDDFLIAVDGGLRHLLTAGLLPDILIGDLDSVSAEDLHIVQEKNIPIFRLDVRKDETDLEIAIQYAVNQGFKEILLLAAIGERIDHTLANILILTRHEWQKINFRVLNESQELFFICIQGEIRGSRGDLVSLIPITEKVTAVRTEGLDYPLFGEDLYQYKARGISNVMSTSHAKINSESGLLLCVHLFSRTNTTEES